VRKELGGAAAEWVCSSSAHYVALSRTYLAEAREEGGTT
jgi:hypothetical protein